MPELPITRDGGTARRVAELLSTSAFLSGPELAAQLGVSRAAISDQVRKLRAAGMPVLSVKGRGYRLGAPYVPLNAERLAEAWSGEYRDLLESVELLWSIDSTNRHLARGPAPGPGRARLCLSEIQTAGRGRRGRSWLMGPGTGLALSLSWNSPLEPQALQGFSLAVGLALAEALEDEGFPGLRLKWPNDLQAADGSKLGGILIELGGAADGGTLVIVGVGINVGDPVDATGKIDQPWSTLDQLKPGSGGERTGVAIAMIKALLGLVSRFRSDLPAKLPERWRRFDALADREVRIFQGDAIVAGVARGVDETGALVLDTGDGLRRFVGGEVSVRPTGANESAVD